MAGAAVKVLAAEVLARLKGMEARGGNLAGVNRFFGGYMKGSIDRNFTAQGRPAAWPGLAPGTLGAFLGSRKSFWNKRKKDGSRTLSKKGRTARAGRLILTDSARLRNSISYNASAAGVTIGTSVIYAAIHQFGGPAGRGHKVTIPPRPFLLFQDEDISYYERLLSTYVMTGSL